MFKKSTLGTGGLAVVGVLFIGIMLLANLLLRGAKLDLTADRLYTISDGTENIVQGLKEPVNLYLFFSEKTATPNPAAAQPRHPRARAARRAGVARPTASSRSRSSTRSRSPRKKIAPTSSASRRCPSAPSGDKLYLGLAATNSTDGKEAIPYPRSAGRGAARIRRRQADPQAVEREEAGGRLAVVAAHAGRLRHADRPAAASRGWSTARSSSSTRCAISSRRSPPSTTTSTCWCIVHPKELPPAALYAIDQFALRGGHILAFVDPNAQADQSARIRTTRWRSSWPTSPRTSSRCSPRGASSSRPARWSRTSSADSWWSACAKASRRSQHIAILGFDGGSMAKDVITARLDSVNMVTAGSLKPRWPARKLKVEPLIRTSAQAGLLPAQRFSDDERPALAARRLQAERRAHRRRARLRQRGQRISRTARPRASPRRRMR